MTNMFQKRVIDEKEEELCFLRHLAWRAFHAPHVLSPEDLDALKRLDEAHCQDTATTSVADIAMRQYRNLNKVH